MGVVATIAIVLVAWCACALVVGVVIGRAIALRPRGEMRPVESGRPQPGGAPLSVSYRERL